MKNSSQIRILRHYITAAAAFGAALLLCFLLSTRTVYADPITYTVTVDTEESSVHDFIEPFYDGVRICEGATLTIKGGSMMSQVPVRVENNAALVVEGSLTMFDQLVLQEGATLVVNGSYYQKADGLFVADKGVEAHITGNAEFLGSGCITNTLVDSEITSEMIVDGNFVYDSSADSTLWGGNGTYYNRVTWKVNGNVTTGLGEGIILFKKLYLTGNDPHMLSIGENDKLGSLYTEENNVVAVPAYMNSVTLETSMTIKTTEGTLFNDIVTGNDTDITIDGDMVAIGKTDVYHKMTVKRDYIQKKGGLYVGENSVMNTEGNISFIEKGYLAGTDSTAVINVGKDFEYDTPNGCTLYSGSGTWYNRGAWRVNGNVTTGKNTGVLLISNLCLTGEDKQVLTTGENDKIDKLTTEGSDEVEVPAYLNAVTIMNPMTLITSENTLFNELLVYYNVELTIDGDVTAVGKTDVYHKMSVKGDYIQKKGGLYVAEDSVMNTVGNLKVIEKGGLSGTAGSAIINIGKDFVYDSPNGCTLYSGNGTWYNQGRWNVKGDFIKAEGSGTILFSKVDLNGDKKQVLSLCDGDEIDDLFIEGSQDVELPRYLKNTTLKNNVNFITFDNTRFNRITLDKDVELNVTGDFYAVNDLRGYDGVSVTVSGDYTQYAGSIDVWGSKAKIEIQGDLQFVNEGGTAETTDSSTILVNGKLTFDSKGNMYGNNGKWSVVGEIEQKKDSGKLIFSDLTLAGNGAQTITTQSNSSIKGLSQKETVSKVSINGFLNNTKFLSDAVIEPGNETEFKNLNLNGHKVTVNGDMVFTDETLDIAANSVLDVNGKLNVKNGYLKMGEGASLNVKDNLVISETGIFDETDPKATVKVEKDVLYSSEKSSPEYAWAKNSAKWMVGGNVKQEEGAGSFNFELLQMNTKGTAVTLPNGRITRLVLVGKLSDFTVTPADCYIVLEEKENGEEPEPGPDPIDPKPETEEIEGGDGATDTQPEIDNETTELTLVKGQKFVLADKDWTSSAPGIVTVSKGNVTAKKAGNATLIRKDRSIDITVIAPYIEKADKTLKLTAGEEGKLNLLGTGSLDVLYSSAAPDIASVDEEGNVTAISKGNAAIMAYVNGVAFKFTVKVADANTSRRDFTREVSLVPNQAVSVKIGGFKANKATWSSDTQVSEPPKGFIFADNVVKINKSGKITAIGSGSTILNGKDSAGSSVTINVTVSDPVEQIIHLNVGTSKALKLYGVKGNLNWIGTDAAVKVSGNKFTAVSAGTATFTAAYENFTYKLTVVAEDPKITDSAFAGKPYSYTIYMKVGDEENIAFNNVTQDVTFISNNNAVAYCDPNLKIHARSKGMAKLTTKINGSSITVKVIVN